MSGREGEIELDRYDQYVKGHLAGTGVVDGVLLVHCWPDFTVRKIQSVTVE